MAAFGLMLTSKIVSSETAELETKCLSKAHQISDLKRDNVMLTSQLEMETMKLEAEKKKLVIAHEQLSEKVSYDSMITMQSLVLVCCPCLRGDFVHVIWDSLYNLICVCL